MVKSLKLKNANINIINAKLESQLKPIKILIDL